MVERFISSWESLFSGAILVSASVSLLLKKLLLKKPFQLPTPRQQQKNVATHSLPEKTQFPKHLPQTQTTTTPTIPLESSHLKVGTDLACKGCKACRLLNVDSMAGAKNSRFCGGLRDGPMAGRVFGWWTADKMAVLVLWLGKTLGVFFERWCKGDVGNVCFERFVVLRFVSW